MTKLTNFFSSLALLAIGGFIFSSCSSTTAPTGSVSSGVSVTTATANSLTVGWTRDASDNGTDTLFVTTAGGANAGNSPVLVTNGSTGSVTGLTVNTEYTIVVGSTIGRSTAFTFTNWAAPSAMMVLSVSSTSIGATWTRGSGDLGVDTIVAMNGSSVAGTALVASGNTGAVTGLADGTVYTISVRNATGTTNSIQWMTADRTPNLQIFESGDPSATDPSALILGTNSKASSLSGLSTADFVLETISDPTVPSNISFVAGVVHNSAWGDTKVDASASDHPDYLVGGLNADYTATNYQADQAASSANSYDIPDDNGYTAKGSRILITTTANGNLALVEIIPDPSGTLYSTNASGYKYVTVNVSYQNTPNQPYAARGHAQIHYTGPIPRKSAK
jgi:hypothetical protein